MKRLAVVLFALVWTKPALADAEPTPELLNFDLNHNGLIDAEEVTPEFLRFINAIYMPKVPWRAEEAKVEVDVEVSEVPVEPEVAPETPEVPDSDSALEEGTEIEVVVEVEEAVEVPETVVPDEPAEVEAPSSEAVGEAVAAKSAVTTRLLLRRKVEGVTLNKRAKSLDDADGAVVSYTNDYKQQTEEWQVQGALLAPIRYETGREIVPGHRVVSAYAFVPSVAFDRKFHSTDTGAEINTLAFRLGSELEIAGGRFFPLQYIRFAPVYATDFDFESSVVAGELQYEALKEEWGLGTPRSCLWSKMQCQWGLVVHLEGGKVLDAGDKDNLVEDQEFLRLGPLLSATFQPTQKPFERLKLDLGWSYLEELSSDEGASDLFESGLSWRLDNSGHINLRAQYRHGDLALTRDKVSIVTTGLEIKF